MDYLYKYKALIRSAKTDIKIRRLAKKSGAYYESHHIIPKSVGGSNRSYNKVLLTPREHFIAHRLLYKLCEGLYGKKHNYTIKMGRAVEQFVYRKTPSRNYKVTARLYDYLKKNKKRIGVSQDTKDKLRRLHTGLLHTEDTKKKMSLARRNNPNHQRAKIWKICRTDERVDIVETLSLWCQLNGYNKNCVSQLKNGVIKSHKDIIGVEIVSRPLRQ